MIEIKEKKCKNCKVYAETIEDEALSTIYNICDEDAFEGQKIRIMPDVHQGKGIVIGFSSTINPEYPMINPSHVGLDIGCSVSLLKFDRALGSYTVDDNGHMNLSDEYILFEHKVKKEIPMGFNINDKNLVNEKNFLKECRQAMSAAASTCPWIDYVEINGQYISDMLKRIGMDEGMFWKSLGTLGGGNHFLEYGEDCSDYRQGHVTVHTGSRNFGLKVAKYWTNIANDSNKIDKKLFREKVSELKNECKDKTKLPEMIQNLKNELIPNRPVGYLDGDDLKGYLTDMVVAQFYAKYNHKMIHKKIREIYKKVCGGVTHQEALFTTHNYIDFEDNIIRKGAINASKDRYLIIPFNMRDGIALCKGLGNEDWNCTAPHGAGRTMSRNMAKSTLSMDDYKESMKDVYSTCVNQGTIDESPMSYKSKEEIVKLISPTVEVLAYIEPMINWKASE